MWRPRISRCQPLSAGYRSLVQEPPRHVRRQAASLANALSYHVFIRLTLPDIVKRRSKHFTTEQFKSQFKHKDRGIFLKMSLSGASHQEGGHLTAINA